MEAFPSAAALSDCSRLEQLHVLDLLFEPNPQLQALLLPCIQSSIFPSYPALMDRCQQELNNLAKVESTEAKTHLHDILGSHPRLGAVNIRGAQSRDEQAQLNEHERDGARLAAMNTQYEARFHGLRYVVFVNGRGMSDIMADIGHRISRGDIAAEEVEAIQARVPHYDFWWSPD